MAQIQWGNFQRTMNPVVSEPSPGTQVASASGTGSIGGQPGLREIGGRVTANVTDHGHAEGRQLLALTEDFEIVPDQGTTVTLSLILSLEGTGQVEADSAFGLIPPFVPWPSQAGASAYVYFTVKVYPTDNPASLLVNENLGAEESLLLSATDDSSSITFPDQKVISVNNVPTNKVYRLDITCEYRAYGIVAKHTGTVGRDAGVATIDFMPNGAQCTVAAYG